MPSWIFHEGKYIFPQTFGTLAHQVMAADTLGDDTFVHFIADAVKVSPTRLDTSHTSQEIGKVVWDRMCLRNAVPSLQDTPHTTCYGCRGEFSDKDILATVCCERAFHGRCLLGLRSCPFCTIAWGGLRCVGCGGHTVRRGEQELHCSIVRRRLNRMSCCGADVHLQCKNRLSHCPGCGVVPSPQLVLFSPKEKL
jgi:hypothetical protein